MSASARFKFPSFLIWAGALFCVLLVIAISARPAAREALRRLNPRIESWVAATLGAEVRLSAIEPRFDLFQPGFEIASAEVSDPLTREPRVRIEELRLRLSLWQSLVRLTPVVGRIQVKHLGITLKESATGGYSSPIRLGGGMSASGAELGIPRIQVETARVQTQALDGSQTELDLKELALQGETLRLESARLQLPNLWQSPAQIKDLSLDLSKKGDSWEIRQARLDFNGLPAELDGTYRQDTSTAPGAVALTLKLGSGELATVRHSVPLPVLKPSLRSWLALAVKGGKMESLRLKLDTELGASAGDAAKTHYELELPVRELELDYREGWPKLRNAQGVLRLKDTAFSFELPSAEIEGGAKLARISGKIADTRASAPDLEITGSFGATADQLTRLLKDGPIQPLGASSLAHFTPSRSIDLNFVARRLLDGAPDLTLSIRDAGIRLVSTQQEITAIQAQVAVTERKISIQEIRGSLAGQELRGSAQLERGPQGPTKTTLKAEIAANLGEIQKWLTPSASRGISLVASENAGPVRIKSELILKHSPEGPASGEGTFEADLTPLELRAPLPLGKPAGQEFKTQGSFSFRGRALQSLESASSWRTHGPNELKVGLIQGAQGPLKLNVRADLDAVDAKAWHELWSQNRSQDPSQTPQTELDLELQIKSTELRWEEHPLRQARLTLAKAGADWIGVIQSQEVSGQIQFGTPLPEKKLTAKFQRVHLPAWKDSEKEETAAEADPAPPAPWDLRTWPSLDVTIDDLQLGTKDYGSFRVRGRQSAERYLFQEFALSGPRFDFTLSEADCAYEGGEPSKFRTSASGTWTLKDYEWPFRRAKSIRSVNLLKGKVRFRGSFAGTPNQFQVRRFNGHLYGTVRQGQFNGVKSFAQSIVNLISASPGDMRKQIVRFYKASFRAEVADGVWKMEFAKGLFGSVFARLWGKANLVSKDLALETRFVPRVEDITDGEKLLSEGFDLDAEEDPRGLITPRYKITGSWDDPKPSLQIFGKDGS